MPMETIIAVVVTYNRINLLKRVIDALLNQTIKISRIIVVNNNSTDGTKEWLDGREDLQVIHQDNLGGAGGFRRGMQEACQNESDYVWIMDDDVTPEADCLEQLLEYTHLPDSGILIPLRYLDNQPFFTEYKRLNFTNPFRNCGISLLQEKDTKQPFLEVQTITFEGPLIHRKVFEKIAYPDSSYFILFDDTDYAYRAILAGFKIYMIPSAKMQRIGSMGLSVSPFNWKCLYDIHNNFVFHKKYGKNFAVKYLRPINRVWMYSVSYFSNIWRSNRFKKEDIFRIIQASVNGFLNIPVNYRNKK
jgi:GT2 family glycosyltransferase